MNSDMKYNYEFLRKCHGLRFRATINGKQEEGIIKVAPNNIVLCYGEPNPGNLMTFERWHVLNVYEAIFSHLPEDFEIVPRDPETYNDWQVGDKIIRNDSANIIIFRCGEVVLYKVSDNRCCVCPYTCKELYDSGYRLVLTDVEKQIIDEKKTFEPQDGDICFIKARASHVVIFKDNKYNVIKTYADFRIDNQYLYDFIFDACLIADIKECRLATEQEKQMLFDALAKEGKRWNAEKKCIEDNPVESNAEEVAAQPDVQERIREELKDYTPKGDIKGFPIEVVSKMLERQYEQTGKVNATVFEGCSIAAKHEGGFDWSKTKEDLRFWQGVISRRKFSVFFKKYPKSYEFKKGEPVLVRDNERNKWRIAAYVSEDVVSFLADTGKSVVHWRYCLPYNEETMHLLGTVSDYEEGE